MNCNVKFNPEKLLILWYLVTESKYQAKYFSKTENNIYGPFSLKQFINSGIISEVDLTFLLVRLIEQKYIKKLYINVADDKLNIKKNKNTIKYDIEALKKLEKSSLSSYLEFIPKKYCWFYLEINKNKIANYISKYIRNWSIDSLTSEKFNVLRSERQIQRVVNEIFKLLENYPPNRLLVNYFKNKGLDFLATLVFLKDEKCIEINDAIFILEEIGFNNGEELKLNFNITVNDRFYDLFKKEGSIYKIDFEALKAGKHSDLSRSGIVQKANKSRETVIEYNSKTYKLYYKGKRIHKLNMSSYAWIVFDIVFNREFVKYEVAVSEIINEDIASSDISDRNRSFRRALKNKLKNKHAPEELLEDNFLKRDGGIVKVSKNFIRNNSL
jgi:hypothetical protein